MSKPKLAMSKPKLPQLFIVSEWYQKSEVLHCTATLWTDRSRSTFVETAKAGRRTHLTLPLDHRRHTLLHHLFLQHGLWRCNRLVDGGRVGCRIGHVRGVWDGVGYGTTHSSGW